jgi:hypothetical protein
MNKINVPFKIIHVWRYKLHNGNMFQCKHPFPSHFPERVLHLDFFFWIDRANTEYQYRQKGHTLNTHLSVDNDWCHRNLNSHYQKLMGNVYIFGIINMWHNSMYPCGIFLQRTDINGELTSCLTKESDRK